MEKEKRIKAELNRLLAVYKTLPEKKLTIALPLMENAAFMKITLEDLQAEINEKGVSEGYKNGNNQSGFKETPAVKSYNAIIKNYEKINARLEGMIPEDRAVSKLDALKNK